MRWPRERPQAEMPDEDDMTDAEAPPEGRLGEIEARIAKLAERFDQLEFVIIEQFEPGMTEGGELPAGNLRDRLDRIEAGLGLLRRDTPATWDETMASGNEILDAAALEARLDEIAARLADLAHLAAAPEGAADVLAARLEALENRLGTVAEEAAARHDSLLSAVVAESAAREAALEGIAAAAATRREDLRAMLAAEFEARHATLLSATGPAPEAGDAVEIDAEALRSDLRAALAEEIDARHAAFLAVLNEQASASGSHAREEAVLTALAEAAEARHAALVDALNENAEAARSLIAAEAAARDAALAAMAEAAESRQGDLRAALAAEIETRHDTLLAALDRAMNRPAPAPDLTQQHRSFAGFATALQTTLNQFEVSVDSILERLDGMARRLEAVEARVAAPAAAPGGDATPAVSGIETSLGALSDGIGALVEVLGQRAAPAPATEANPAMLDQLGAVVTAVVGEAARSSQSVMDDTLRDLRLTMAEIAADSLRLRST
jgi:uncharacterized coiled-coil protein SlyX